MHLFKSLGSGKKQVDDDLAVIKRTKMLSTTKTKFNDLPDDILTIIFIYAFTYKARVALDYSLISQGIRSFFTSSRSNLIWRNISKARWGMINAQMNIATWYEFYKRRFIAQAKKPRLGANMIESCALQFKCPLQFDELTVISDTIRHCSVCDKNVYLISSLSEFKHHQRLKQCVAYKPSHIYGSKLHVFILGSSQRAGQAFINYIETSGKFCMEDLKNEEVLNSNLEEVEYIKAVVKDLQKENNQYNPSSNKFAAGTSAFLNGSSGIGSYSMRVDCEMVTVEIKQVEKVNVDSLPYTSCFVMVFDVDQVEETLINQLDALKHVFQYNGRLLFIGMKLNNDASSSTNNNNNSSIDQWQKMVTNEEARKKLAPVLQQYDAKCLICSGLSCNNDSNGGAKKREEEVTVVKKELFKFAADYFFMEGGEMVPEQDD